MRTTLAPSVINTMLRNLKKGNFEGGIFEISKVYIAKQLPLTDFPEERVHVCIGMWGSSDFFDVKGVTENIADSFNTKFE